MQLGIALLLRTTHSLVLSFEVGREGGIGTEQVWGVVYFCMYCDTNSPPSHQSKTMRWTLALALAIGIFSL